MAQAVLCRLLTAESRFAPGSVYLGFVVDKMALGQVFLRVFLFSPVNIITPLFSKLIYHLRVEQCVR
jgi:hypothetical protein